MPGTAPSTSSPLVSRTIPVNGDLPLRVLDGGAGRPALVLHGGGGIRTVQAIADHLASSGHRVLVPTHPGWDGTERPAWLTSIDDLALCYRHLLEDLGLTDVLVVGSSLGGWVAAEMAVRDAAGRIGQVAIIDGVGIDVPGHPITDFFALTPRGVAEHSYHDPDAFFVDPSTLAPEVRANQIANVATMRVLAGDPYMHDPKLARRLGRVSTPATVLWGASDRIATPGYGRAFASAIGAATGRSADFVLIPEAGHLPQLERPETTLRLLDSALGVTV